MNTCGTCKHKGKPIEIEDWDDFGHNKPTGYFLCERAKHAGHDRDLLSVPNQKMTVVDGSGYYAALCVEDDFGCNLWERG